MCREREEDLTHRKCGECRYVHLKCSEAEDVQLKMYIEGKELHSKTVLQHSPKQKEKKKTF